MALLRDIRHNNFVFAFIAERDLFWVRTRQRSDLLGGIEEPLGRGAFLGQARLYRQPQGLLGREQAIANDFLTIPSVG